jgi:hypothetical protein
MKLIEKTHLIASDAEIDPFDAQDDVDTEFRSKTIQRQTESLYDFFERFQVVVDKSESCGLERPMEGTLANNFIKCLDRGRFAKLQTFIKNNRSLGLDKGPTTLLEAYNAATRCKVVSVNNIPVPAAVFTAQHSTPAHDGGRVDGGRGGRGRGRLGGRGVGRGGLIKTNDTAEGEKKADGCILCGEKGHFFR